MIKKLRAKLILACMFSLAVVLLVILGGVNLMSYQKVVSDADTVLSLLAANDGAFPKLRAPQEEKDEGYFAPFGTPGGKPNLFNQRIMSPETPYESRFFSVLLGEDGQAVETDTGQIAAVDAEQATDYAQKAAASGKTSGFWMTTAFWSRMSPEAYGSFFWTAAAVSPPSAPPCWPAYLWLCWGWQRCCSCC